MTRYDWPVSLLEGHGISEEILVLFDTYVKDSDKKADANYELYKEHEILKETSAKQDRYIAALEKQLILLQKTLDLVDRNGGDENGRC
jgi:hypothetical protein